MQRLLMEGFTGVPSRASDLFNLKSFQRIERSVDPWWCFTIETTPRFGYRPTNRFENRIGRNISKTLKLACTSFFL